VGGIFAPIFLGGELRAEVDRTRAVKQRLLYEYGQQVLVAFGEVEDALVLEANQAKRIDNLEVQVELADQSYRQLEIEYFYGAGSYIDVLVAQVSLQELRRTLLSARLDLVEHRISLYRALAGALPSGTEPAE
jgi:outer membrane protein TolC